MFIAIYGNRGFSLSQITNTFSFIGRDLILQLELKYDRQLGRDFAKERDTHIRRANSQSSDGSFGIAGNTFRAFRNLPEKPSNVYREWAEQTTQRILRKQPRLSTDKAFQEWHRRLVESINRNWKKRQGTTLPFAHKFKLIDLFLKWLFLFEECPIELSKSLLAFANCALDRQTLCRINDCVSGILPIRKPAMGDVQNIRCYEFCQSLVGSFSSAFGGTRLMFDLWAWKSGG